MPPTKGQIRDQRVWRALRHGEWTVLSGDDPRSVKVLQKEGHIIEQRNGNEFRLIKVATPLCGHCNLPLGSAHASYCLLAGMLVAKGHCHNIRPEDPV